MYKCQIVKRCKNSQLLEKVKGGYFFRENVTAAKILFLILKWINTMNNKQQQVCQVHYYIVLLRRLQTVVQISKSSRVSTETLYPRLDNVSNRATFHTDSLTSIILTSSESSSVAGKLKGCRVPQTA